jgi:hypothetical protein
VLKLSYRVRDERGETAERITVYRGPKAVATVTRGLRQTESSLPYWVAWRAPRTRFVGRFCVRATDGAGNAATSCAALRGR